MKTAALPVLLHGFRPPSHEWRRPGVAATGRVVSIVDDGPSAEAYGATHVRLATLALPTFASRRNVLLTALSASAVEEHFNPLVVCELVLDDLAKPRLVS